MQSQMQSRSWGMRAPSFWMTFLVAAGIIFVGIRFFITPYAAAADFGIPLPGGKAAFFGSIKGIRDIFSGLVVLAPLLARNLRFTLYAFGTAIIIPATDCFLVFSANGAGDISHMAIHGGTALYMALTSLLLGRSLNRQKKEQQ